MCEPVTLGYIAVAATVAGAATSAYSAHQQAKAGNAINANNQQIAENNAKLQEQQALDIQARGESQAQEVRRRAAAMESQQRVGLAANGLDLNSGTAFDLIGQTDFFGRQDAQTTRDNAAKDAWAVRTGASNTRQQGQNYSGRTSAAGAAGISLLGSAGSVANKWYTYNGNGGAGQSGTTGWVGQSYEN